MSSDLAYDQEVAGTLIILGGLPGVGKTTIARELARSIAAVHLRIDSIEQAIEAWAPDRPLHDAGYRVAYAVAEDNLRAGLTVIADSVNPIALTRDAWFGVAQRAGARALEVEIVCSDQVEHRRRVEARGAPPWAEVVAREYNPWRRERLVLDTAGRSVERNIDAIRAALCR